MRKQEHTPGPFRVDARYESSGEVEYRIKAGVNVTVAEVNNYEVDTEQASANAFLFAGAPDLYAAAKRAFAVLKAQGESVRPGNVLGALAAAIEKAEGAQ